MNTFTNEQLQVIHDLADYYFELKLPFNGAFISLESYDSLKQNYITGIIAGLQDPDVWGLTEAQEAARVDS